MTPSITPSETTLRTYFQNKAFYEGIPVFHINNEIRSVDISSEAQQLYHVEYAGETNRPHIIDGDTIVYIGAPWNARVYNRINLANELLGHQLAYHEGALILYERSTQALDYWRHENGAWQITSLVKRLGHWELGAWRANTPDPHNLRLPIIHMRRDVACPSCGEGGI